MCEGLKKYVNRLKGGTVGDGNSIPGLSEITVSGYLEAASNIQTAGHFSPLPHKTISISNNFQLNQKDYVLFLKYYGACS